MPGLKELIYTVVTDIVIPPHELQFAFENTELCEIPASLFMDPTNKEMAGRVKLCLGKAILNKEFKRNCPTLHALYKGLRDLGAQICVMLMWHMALWMHIDRRALVNSDVDRSQYNNGFEIALAQKLANPAPKMGLELGALTLGGTTAMTYGVRGITDLESALTRKYMNPSKVLLSETIFRPQGTMHFYQIETHAGFATATLNVTAGTDAVLDVQLLADHTEGKQILFHAASAVGANEFSVSLLLTTQVESRAAVSKFLAEFSATIPSSSSSAGSSSADHDWSAFKNGGKLHLSATKRGWPRGNNSDGKGGASDEAHYDASVAGGGCERGPMTGEAKDEHYDACVAGGGSERGPMKGKDREDWGSYIIETAKANGKTPGNQDHDAEEKIRELNTISHPGQTGWMVHFSPVNGNTPPRKHYYHPKLQLFFHRLDTGYKMSKMTFKQAKQVALDDAEARAGRKKLKAN